MRSDCLWSDTMHFFVRDFTATGSRIICKPPPKDTDYDILVRVATDRLDDFMKAAVIDGWTERPLTGHEDEYEDCADFWPLRKGDLNLIVCVDEEFYKRFDAATHVAKRLNLLNKPDRIALFQAVLYGNKWEEVPSSAELRAEMRADRRDRPLEVES
jgi:hypothetical protein